MTKVDGRTLRKGMPSGRYKAENRFDRILELAETELEAVQAELAEIPERVAQLEKRRDALEAMRDAYTAPPTLLIEDHSKPAETGEPAGDDEEVDEEVGAEIEAEPSPPPPRLPPQPPAPRPPPPAAKLGGVATASDLPALRTAEAPAAAVATNGAFAAVKYRGKTASMAARSGKIVDVLLKAKGIGSVDVSFIAKKVFVPGETKPISIEGWMKNIVPRMNEQLAPIGLCIYPEGKSDWYIKDL